MSDKKTGGAFGSPVFLMLLGAVAAVVVLICLFTLDFTWIQLFYYVPGLALAALLIFGGRGKWKAGKK